MASLDCPIAKSSKPIHLLSWLFGELGLSSGPQKMQLPQIVYIHDMH